eukprot:4446797-Alexandrium_andersonii.AAC.1
MPSGALRRLSGGSPELSGALQSSAWLSRALWSSPRLSGAARSSPEPSRAPSRSAAVITNWLWLWL